MRVKFRGVRGSLPAPLAPEEIKESIRRGALECFRRGFKSERDLEDYLEREPVHYFGGFGGNTTCVEISSGRQSVIIDAGSGIRSLGAEIKGPSETHIFMTHFHWDHLIGLMFFNPIFVPGNVIHMYAVQPELKAAIQTLFRRPNFPVAFENLAAEIHFHQLKPRKPFVIGDITLTPYLLDHPDPCWGYRVEANGQVLAHCVDTEGVRTSADELAEDLGLYRGANAMIFDAQYTISEISEKVNWGHSAAPIGLDIAMRERIEYVYFVHHDPNASDLHIARAQEATRDYYLSHLKAEKRAGRPAFEVNWKFAQEGEVLILGKS